MRFTDLTDRLQMLHQRFGQTAMGYRLRRELIQLIAQYEKDAILSETNRQAKTKTG